MLAFLPQHLVLTPGVDPKQQTLRGFCGAYRDRGPHRIAERRVAVVEQMPAPALRRPLLTTLWRLAGSLHQ